MPNEYDLNGNGKIDPVEHEIMLEDRRRRMEDADAKRDAQRRMTWFALSGMILYPFVILVASVTGFRDSCEVDGGNCRCVCDWCIRHSRCIFWF
jgi:hypothetical protein